ncbi:hypothetical protein WJX74_008013 [Apatococcus lobatus]|uniref:LysM domain-containing protein n=1 Tax=Apatococcus lobatus TaxID=904363 RepID=A0AAW1QWH5_9CHLO
MSSTPRSQRASNEITETEVSSSSEQPSLFQKHKVSKLDTLAGLAIRYNVTVSDIKRANGLLSDNSMFARTSLIIPNNPIPVGPEYSTWAGMIVTQFGRLPGGAPPSCSAAASSIPGTPPRQASGALLQLRNYYGFEDVSPAVSAQTSPGPSERGLGRTMFRGQDDFMDEVRTSSGEVELTEFEPRLRRHPHSSSTSRLDDSYAGTREGETYDDRLRHRRGNPSPMRDQDGSLLGNGLENGGLHMAGPSFPSSSQPPMPPRQGSGPRSAVTPDGPSPPGWSGGSSGRATVTGGSPQPQRAGPRRDSFLERIRRAASQPALARPGGPNLSQLADAAIESLSDPPTSEAGFGTFSRVAGAVMPVRQKAVAKKE